MRLCSEMPAPPQSLQVYLTRLCSQMAVLALRGGVRGRAPLPRVHAMHAAAEPEAPVSAQPAAGGGTEVVKRNHGFVEPVVANGEVSTGAPLPVRRRRERDEEHKGMSFGGPPAGRGTAQGSKLSSGTQKL